MNDSPFTICFLIATQNQITTNCDVSLNFYKKVEAGTCPRQCEGTIDIVNNLGKTQLSAADKAGMAWRIVFFSFLSLSADRTF